MIIPWIGDALRRSYELVKKWDSKSIVRELLRVSRTPG